MYIAFECKELEELQMKIESVCDSLEKQEVNKKIVQRCGDITIPVLKRNIPKSKKPYKSGKKGNRPVGHLADNVPSKVVKKQGGYFYMLIGWENIGDKTQFFYAKYLEWGTSQMPPIAMFGKTQQQLEKNYEAIAEKEYQALLDRKLGR